MMKISNELSFLSVERHTSSIASDCLEHRKDVKGILMNDGRLFCLKCFRQNPPSMFRRKRYLESRIGSVAEVSPRRDVGLLVTVIDLQANDIGRFCDKCGEKII